MKHRRTIVRAAALVSSVSIVAVYVSCRTNDAHEPTAAPDQPKPTTIEHMGGSKSAEIFPVPPPPPATQSESKAVMGGSKSMRIIDPKDTKPAQTTPAPK